MQTKCGVESLGFTWWALAVRAGLAPIFCGDNLEKGRCRCMWKHGNFPHFTT
jgi:hypothetical protein